MGHGKMRRAGAFLLALAMALGAAAPGLAESAGYGAPASAEKSAEAVTDAAMTDAGPGEKAAESGGEDPGDAGTDGAGDGSAGTDGQDAAAYLICLPEGDGVEYTYDDTHEPEEDPDDGFTILLYGEGEQVLIRVTAGQGFALYGTDGSLFLEPKDGEFDFTMPDMDLQLVFDGPQTEPQAPPEASAAPGEAASGEPGNGKAEGTQPTEGTQDTEAAGGQEAAGAQTPSWAPDTEIQETPEPVTSLRWEVSNVSVEARLAGGGSFPDGASLDVGVPDTVMEDEEGAQAYGKAVADALDTLCRDMGPMYQGTELWALYPFEVSLAGWEGLPEGQAEYSIGFSDREIVEAFQSGMRPAVATYSVDHERAAVSGMEMVDEEDMDAFLSDDGDLVVDFLSETGIFAVAFLTDGNPIAGNAGQEDTGLSSAQDVPALEAEPESRVGTEAEAETETVEETETGTETDGALAAKEPAFTCGKEEHIHGEGCYDAEGNLVCLLEEHAHTDACRVPAGQLNAFISAFRLMSAARLQLADILADEAIDTRLVAVSPTGTRYEDPTADKVKIYEDETGEWQFFASLNSMAIKDHSIQEGAVYEYRLPEALIPMEDVLEEGEDAPDPDDISTWKLLVNNGRAQARGCIEKTAEGRYNLLLVFLPGTTQGEIDITVSYQYAATLDTAKKDEDGRVDIPFEMGGDYSVLVTERPAGLHIVKTAQWVTDDGTETGSLESSNGERRVKYTVTFTNPNPGQPFTGTFTDVGGNDSVVFLYDYSTAQASSPKIALDKADGISTNYGDSSTPYYWKYETMVDGSPVDMSHAITQGLNTGIKTADGTIEYKWDIRTEFGPARVCDSISVTLNGLEFETFSYSYTVTCLDLVSRDTSGTSARRYSTTTRLEGGGLEEQLKGPDATRNYDNVCLDGGLTYGTSGNSRNTGTYPQYDFKATVDPKGSDWVMLRLDPRSGSDYIGLYSMMFGKTTASTPDWCLEYRIGGQKLEYKGPGDTSYYGIYDPVARLEYEDYIRYADASSSTYTYFTAKRTLPDGRDIMMVVSKDTVNAGLNCDSTSNVGPNFTPLQYVNEGSYNDSLASRSDGTEGYGKPYPVSVYLFGLRGKPVDFTYRKYDLTYSMIPDSTLGGGINKVGSLKWSENVYGQNARTRSFKSIGVIGDSGKVKQFADTKYNGYVQEDGSIRFNTLWDFSDLRDFLNSWNGVSNSKFKDNYYRNGSTPGMYLLQLILTASLPKGFKLQNYDSPTAESGNGYGYDRQGLLTKDSLFLGTGAPTAENGSQQSQSGYKNVVSVLLTGTDSDKDTHYFGAVTPNTGYVVHGNGLTVNNSYAPGASYLNARPNTYWAKDFSKGLCNRYSGNVEEQLMWLMWKNNGYLDLPYRAMSYYIAEPDTKGGSYSFENNVSSQMLLQAWHAEVQRPIAEEADYQVASYPTLSKTISTVLDEENPNKEKIKSTITGSAFYGFTGVFNIHDDMSGSFAYTLNDKDDSVVVGEEDEEYYDHTKIPSEDRFEEELAKRVKLESVKITFNEGGRHTIVFDTIHDGVNTAKVSADNNPFTGSSDVTAYLTYYSGAETVDPDWGSLGLGSNMQGGFDLKVANLLNATDIKVEYECSFDAAEYAQAAGAYGTVHTLFTNSAGLNYNLIRDDATVKAAGATAKTSGFAFSAQPDAMLEWDDANDEKNRENGLYTNGYHGELDVGTGTASEVYLALQVNQVLELAKDGKSVGEIPLSDILPYLRVGNLNIRASNRRWPAAGGSEQWDAIGSGGSLGSDIYEVTVVSDPATTLAAAPAPEKGGSEACKKISGNLLCLKVRRKDGKPIDPQTFFDVSFDISLTKDPVNGKTFRQLGSYHGGALGIQPQLSICYPFTAGPAGIMAVAATAGTWVSAGAMLERVDYLVWPEGSKSSSKRPELDAREYQWQMRYRVGSVGKDELVSRTLKDILYIYAQLAGKPVEDDLMNKELCDLFFDHITVKIDRLLYGKPDADTEYYPAKAPAGTPAFDVKAGPIPPKIYGPKENYPDDGHGWDSYELFRVDCEGLPELSEVVVDYTITVDWDELFDDLVKNWGKRFKALEEAGYKPADVMFSKYVNAMDDGSGEESFGSEFENPAAILGTIRKSSEANWKKQEIAWSIDFNVKGDAISGYRLDDLLAAGKGTGEPTANDSLALKNTRIKGFAIYEVKDSGAPDSPTLNELFSYNGPFTAGTSVPLDDTAYWTGASLVFGEDASFALATGTLSAGDLRIQYTTELDEDGFIGAGGVLSDGYSLYNTAAASAPGMKVLASKGETFDGPKGPFSKEVSEYEGGLGSAREWKITAETSGKRVKDVVISDSLSAQPEGILPFLSISDMKVELADGEGEATVIYDTLKGIDDLKANTGTLTQKGGTAFELRFSALPEGTTVVVTYHTAVDEDAYREAVEASAEEGAKGVYSDKDRYALSNNASYKQAGWADRTATADDDVDVPEPVTKTGVVATPAGKDQDARVVWDVDIHLDTIASADKLQEIEEEGGCASITDSLPYGLKWDEGYNNNKGAEVWILKPSGSGWAMDTKVADGDFSAELDPDNPQKLVIKVYKPSTNRHVRVRFRTEATANLGSVKNAVSVSLAGSTKTDWSEPVEGVHTSRNGGTIFSRNLPKATLEAVKTVDGETPGETFRFRAEQVEPAEGGGWAKVPGGYDETAQSAGDGSVTFPETGFLDPGDYYFRVSEARDTAKDEAGYEGTSYLWDTRSYIVHVQTLPKDNSFQVLQDIIEVLDGEADISQMDKPAFENKKKPLREVSVEKSWNDGGDRRSLRPDGITVQLWRNGAPYAAYEGYTQELSDANGWSYTWSGLPANGTYTVKELDEFPNSEYYEQGEPETVTEGTKTTVKLENHLRLGNLSVHKTVEGNAGETDRQWHFKVTLSDTTINGTYGGMTFRDGAAEFTLRHDETAEAEGLPAGTGYTVVEQESGKDRYKTTSENDKGKVPPDETAHAEFTNRRNRFALPDTGGPGPGAAFAFSTFAILTGIASALAGRKRKRT